MSFPRGNGAASFPDGHEGRYMDVDKGRFMDSSNRGAFQDVVQGASRMESGFSHAPSEFSSKRRNDAYDAAGETAEFYADAHDMPVSEQTAADLGAKGNNIRRKIRTDPPALIRALRERRPTHTLSQQRITQLQNLFGKFARPKINSHEFIKQNPDQALFYLQDLDYNTIDHTKYGPPIVRIATLTEKGNSAAIIVRNVPPHFYVKPNKILTARIAAHGPERALREFHSWLEERVRLRVDDGQQKLPEQFVTELTLLKRFTLYGYQKDPVDVIQVTVANPKLVVPARDCLWALRRKKDAFEFEAGEGDDAADDHDAMEVDDDGNNEAVEWEDEQAKQAAEQVEFDQSHEGELLRKDPYEVFEADVLFTLRAMIDKDLRGCAWFSVPTTKLLPPPTQRDRQTRCQLEFWIDFADITSRPEKQDVPPQVRQLSFDLEMASITGKFPDADNDPIISISAMLFTLEDGNKPVFATSFYVGQSAPSQYKELPEGTPLIDLQFGGGHPYHGKKWDFKSEAEMLLAFHWLRTNICDEDYIEGYNSKNFDRPYLLHRADTLGVSCITRKESRLLGDLVSVQSKTFSSKAYGTREDASIRSWGVVDWDLLPILKRDKKMRNYQLNTAGTEFLGETKYGLDHKLISPYWIGPEATPETRRIVRDYNHQDVWLTHRINTKLCYIYRNQGMARVTTLPIDLIITRGQAIKTTVLLLRRCKDANIVVPTFATRQEKLTRAGYGIEPGKYNPEMLGKRYREDQMWDDDNSSDDEEEESEEQAPDPKTAATFQSTLAPTNARQDAQQVQFRPGVDRMYMVQLGEGEENDITVCRRHSMWCSANIKNNETLQKAFRETQLQGGRVLLLFTANRRDMHVPKPIYGVAEMVSDYKRELHTTQWTNSLKATTPCAEVRWLVQFDREDPRMLPEFMRRHKDCDLINNKEVEELFLKGNLKGKKKGKKRVKEGDKYEGAVVIHPICGLYLVPVWTLDFSSLYPSAIICYNMCWTTLISKEEALKNFQPSDYHVTPFGSYFVRKHIREGLLPKMLKDVIASRNESKALAKKAKAAGNMAMFEVHESDQNAKKIVANGSYGYTGAKTAPIPCLAIAASTTAYGRDAIMLVWEKIETEFELPPELTPNGERPIIIGGDTDSVFGIWPNVTDPKLAMELAIKAAEWVSKKYFQEPMNTVFEKLMFPLIMEGRKRYGYVYWGIEAIKEGHPDMVQVPGTKDSEKKKWARIESKGMETVRRDNCFLVSDGIASKLRKVLADRDPIGALVELQKEVDELDNQLVDPSLLVVSKSLSKEPEDYDPRPIHAKLALKLRARDPVTAPRCGDRVPYVVVQGSAKDKTSDLGEDPLYALKKGIPLNATHYAESYRKPCKRLFDPILPGAVERIFYDTELPQEKPKQTGSLVAMFQKRKMTDEERARIEEDQRKKARTAAPSPGASAEKKTSTRMQSDREASNKTLAWARKVSKVSVGDVDARLKADRMARMGTTRKRTTTHASKATPLAGIVRVVTKCLSCQTAVPCDVCPKGKCDCEEKQLAAVCPACTRARPAAVADLRKRATENANKWKEQSVTLWDGCKSCAGSMEAALECSNSSCRQFFVRDQAKIEYERADTKLKRFSIVPTPME